jgi:hypothetical protein
VRRYVVHNHQVDHERLQHRPVPGRHRDLWDLVLLIAIHHAQIGGLGQVMPAVAATPREASTRLAGLSVKARFVPGAPGRLPTVARQQILQPGQSRRHLLVRVQQIRNLRRQS